VLQAVQQKLASTQRELSSVEAQMEVCEREARAGELVNQELNQLSDDVRVYQSIGKM
jgi:chaperonin cofactor prefoldin